MSYHFHVTLPQEGEQVYLSLVGSGWWGDEVIDTVRFGGLGGWAGHDGQFSIRYFLTQECASLREAMKWRQVVEQVVSRAQTAAIFEAEKLHKRITVTDKLLSLLSVIKSFLTKPPLKPGKHSNYESHISIRGGSPELMVAIMHIINEKYKGSGEYALVRSHNEGERRVVVTLFHDSKERMINITHALSETLKASIPDPYIRIKGTYETVIQSGVLGL